MCCVEMEQHRDTVTRYVLGVAAEERIASAVSDLAAHLLIRIDEQSESAITRQVSQ